MGVGSVGVAALQLDRRFIGIEINREYFIAAKNRIDMVAEQTERCEQQYNDDGMLHEDLIVPQLSNKAKFNIFFKERTDDKK